MDIHAYKAHRTPNRFNTKRTSSRHLEIKPLKIKDKEFETSKRKEKQSQAIKGVPHKYQQFSQQKLCKRKRDNVFKVLKRKRRKKSAN